jgi:hypothetical protein
MTQALRKIKTVDDRYGIELDWLAYRVAKGRERAGLHYSSDTIAGFTLASEAMNHINFTTADGFDLIAEATKEWP